MYAAVYRLAFDGHVGRSRVRNPAPLYFFSCFMFSFLCFPNFFIYTPMEVVSPGGMFVYTAVYMLLMELQPAQPKKEKNTRRMYAAVYRLAADGHLGRSRVRSPAPLYFFHVLCFHFCVFLFVYLHAHGGCAPSLYVCLPSSVHACC